MHLLSPLYTNVDTQNKPPTNVCIHTYVHTSRWKVMTDKQKRFILYSQVAYFLANIERSAARHNWRCDSDRGFIHSSSRRSILIFYSATETIAVPDFIHYARARAHTQRIFCISRESKYILFPHRVICWCFCCKCRTNTRRWKSIM